MPVALGSFDGCVSSIRTIKLKIMATNDSVRHVVIYVDHGNNEKCKSSPSKIPPSPSGHCEVFEEHRATPSVQAGVGVLLGLNALYFCAALIFSQGCHSICLLIDAYQSFFITASLFIHMLDFKIPASAHGGASTRQTFSWGRVRLLGQVSNMVFLLSLMFSQLVEAVQTMVHTSHLDALHKPAYVLGFGVTKFLLSLLTFIVLRTTKVHKLSQPPHVLLLERRPRFNSDVSFSSRTMRFRSLSGRSVSNMEDADKEHTLANEMAIKARNISNSHNTNGKASTMFTTAAVEREPLDKDITMQPVRQPIELEALLSPAEYFGTDKGSGGSQQQNAVPNTPPSTVTSTEDVQPSISVVRDSDTAAAITDETSSFSTIINSGDVPVNPNRVIGSNALGIIESLPPPAPPRVDAALYDGTNARDVVVQRHVSSTTAERKSDDAHIEDASDPTYFAIDGSEALSKNPYVRDHQRDHASLMPKKAPTSATTRKFCSNFVFDSIYVALNKWLNFVTPLAVIASAGAILYWPPDMYDRVKLVDPLIALVLIAAIGMAIVPSAMELIFHLLLTVPKDIFAAGGVHRLRECVREQYPRILDIHSLRVWRHDPYNPASIVFTCHIVLEKPSHYSPAFADELQRFIASLLGAYRATCMTIQPEFYPLAQTLVVAQNKRYPCQSVCCDQSVRARPKHRRKRSASKQRNSSSVRHQDVESFGAAAVSGSDNEHAANVAQPLDVALHPSPSVSPRGRNKSGSSKLSATGGPAPTTIEQSELELAPLFSYSTYFRDEENAKKGVADLA